MFKGMTKKQRSEFGKKLSEVSDSSQVAGSVCDHDLGYTFDYEGPSIFSVSDGDQTEGLEIDDNHGIVYWDYCPHCGEKLDKHNAGNQS